MKHHKVLVAWQLARKNVLAITHHADRHCTPSRSSLYEQLRRAATSVQLNIAEGQAFGPTPRCKHHLLIAFGSAVETTEVLELLQDLDGGLEGMIETSNSVQALTFKLWKSIRVHEPK